jgi:hypothetical protein
MASHDLIESYVDELRKRLGSGVDTDPLVAEVHDHLEQSAASLVTDGLSVDEANRLAVRRFGDPTEIARQLLKHQIGTATAFTRAAGAVAVGGAVLFLVAFAPMTYSVLLGGNRPRVDAAVTLLYGLGQLTLLALLVGLVLRAAKRPQRRLLLLVVAPISALAIYNNIGFYSVADLLDTAWIIPILQLALVAGLVALLKPWTVEAGYGQRWARVCLVAAAFIGLARGVIDGVADSMSSVDGNEILHLTNILLWLSAPLLVAAMLPLGRRLWVERTRPALTA